MKVLIADDESGIRKLVHMTLDSGAYQIIEASDGVEALRIAREQQPDIVLLDVMMPGMSGLDVCRQIKSDPSTSHQTVVMLTALSQDYDVAAGLAAGADDYLTKPFSPLRLMRRIDQVLSKRAC
jgi:DNA-binding response OmpR family regulator